MSKELIVNATNLETRLAIVEDDQVTEIFIERQKNRSILGNIYKGRVTKVLPGMQAAFVDIGLERHAFLYVSDFFEDYEEYEELFRRAENPEIEELLRAEAKTEPRLERPERPERPERSERPERLERPERPERVERLEREKPERPERPERTERIERAERAEKPARAEEAERPERTPRPERADRVEASDDSKRSRRRRGRREPLRPSRGKESRFEVEAIEEVVPGEHHIEPLPGESFAHLTELPQLPTTVETEADRPETLAVWDPMFLELNRPDSDQPNAFAEPPAEPVPPREPEEAAPEAPPPAEEVPVKSKPGATPPPVEERRRPSGRRTGQGAAGKDKREQVSEAAPPDPSAAPQSEPVVEFAPATPPAEEPPDAEASVEEKPEIREFAARPEVNRKRRSTGNRPNGRAQIGDLLREGQEILVQVAKEPIGKKGARITSYVALPGRYLVFMPTVDHVGVSRKIASDSERQRLKEIVTRLRGEFGKGFIVRTVGENHTEDDFRADMVYLTKTWEELRSKADRVSGPTLVHSEPSLVQRVVRDYFNDGYRAIRVDDEQEYERIVEFVAKFNPELVNRVRLYNKETPIFDQYGITAEIEKALKQKVWLKNGGYIVLNQTEALVAIDVNTGKFVGSTNSLEDTITRTNLDAVKEVVRQIRLRDLGGIIIIDFIDMDERRNRQKVMEALQQELAKDKSPYKILQFNEFGLVAITRKRVKQSLERTLCQPCLFCSGTGMTKSVRTICYSIHQEVRKLLPHFNEGDELIIRCHPDVSKGFRDGEREVLVEIEEMAGRIVTVKSDPLMHIEQFDIVEG
jgi:ribonuclease G